MHPLSAYTLLVLIRPRIMLQLVVAAMLGACGGTSGDADRPEAGTAMCDGAGCWKRLAPMIGSNAQEVAVVAARGKVYVLGGFTGSGTIVSDVRVYDPASDTWSLAAPMPMALHHVNAEVVDDVIYLVGAMRGASFTAIGNTWAYDPLTNEWSARASMPAGTERGAAGVGVAGGKIYVVGGVRGTPVAQVSVYDPGADMWKILLPLPRALDHLEAAGVGGLLYAMGGRNGVVTAVVDTVQVYDPVANTWSPRAPMLTARAGVGAGVVDGKIIVVGGEGSEVDPDGVFPQTERYDPRMDSWEALPRMRTPRHGMGAVGLDGTLFVPAGATRHFFAATNVVEALVP